MQQHLFCVFKVVNILQHLIRVRVGGIYGLWSQLEGAVRFDSDLDGIKQIFRLWNYVVIV